MKLPLLALALPSLTASAAKPNFVVFFADDMGFSQPSGMSDRSGWAGDNGTIATPNMDKLAAEGVTFTSWYSGFHVCSPSRAAMVTGRLSVRSGIGFVGSGSNGVFTAEAVGCLPTNETTIADAMKPSYMTGAVGKWHLGQQPQCLPLERGFDYYFGIPFSCDMGISAWGYRNHSAQPFQARPLPLINQSTIVEQPTNLATISVRYTHAALEFVALAKAAAKPFFLYVPFNHVHNPNFASLEFCNTSTRGTVGDAAQEVDHSVGAIMAGIAADGLDEQTVYFFTSDNGAPVRGNDPRGNGPLRDGKFTPWEGGIREPAAVRWKGTIVPRVTDELAATYDIFATVLSLAGIESPAGVVIDGKDLTPILMNKGPSLHDCLIHYYSPQSAGTTLASATSGVAAVRCGKYKANFFTHSTVCNKKGCGPKDRPLPVDDGAHEPPIMFDVSMGADIGEKMPLDVTEPKVAAALLACRAALAAHLKTVEMVPNQMIGALPKHSKNGCSSVTAAPSCVGGNDLSVAVCKDPTSKAKYPQWPNCTSDPEYYGTDACRHANRNCIAKCMPPGEQ